MSGDRAPPRILFISGIPEPLLSAVMNFTHEADATPMPSDNDVQIMNESITLTPDDKTFRTIGII